MLNIFDNESTLFATLAHPKRLELLHLLSHGSLSVSQIVAMTGIAQATVSQYLMLLRDQGLVKVAKHGQIREYAIATPHLRRVLTASRALLHALGGEEGDFAHLHPFTDPVCKMEVTVHTAATSLVHAHTRYYFCAQGCAKKFQKNPSQYLSEKKAHQSAHLKGQL